MAVKKQAKEQTLEDKLWDTAELLRGKVSPTSYKDIALGLLFLKFISNRYDVRRAEMDKGINNTTAIAIITIGFISLNAHFLIL